MVTIVCFGDLWVNEGSVWGQSTLPPKKVCLQKKIAIAANLLPPKVCREKFAVSPEKFAPYILPPKKSLPPFKRCMQPTKHSKNEASCPNFFFAR